jgi:hypothetical protein
MRNLPVVPICRSYQRLPRRANQKHRPAHPASTKEGRFAIVMNVEAGCGGRDNVVRAGHHRAKKFVSGQGASDERH